MSKIPLRKQRELLDQVYTLAWKNYRQKAETDETIQENANLDEQLEETLKNL